MSNLRCTSRGLISFILVIGATLPAQGHDGGLDSYGCHHDRKQGGYHCHEGQFAGQSFSSKEEMLQKPQEGEQQAPGTARVISVIDGDTVDVSIDGKVERIRLIGINTPETKDPRRPKECFGEEASRKAEELLNRKTVTLEADPTQGERDRYGRLLRYIWLPDGQSFNLVMIQEGYAFEYTYDIPYKYQFKKAEREAKEGQKGLWAPDTCNGELKPDVENKK
jgi:micrococcal nuclease